MFDHASENVRNKQKPLAARMRPTKINQVIGQTHLLGSGAPLRISIEKGKLWSAILWGGPGTGKTTLATVAASTANYHVIRLSAITSGVTDLRKSIQEAQDLMKINHCPTLLFIDEIHAFNKNQQDALLPYVEDGTITFWGATTYNPYFEINTALISRVRVLRLEPLSNSELAEIIRRAIVSKAMGLGNKRLTIDETSISLIASLSNGDARVALNWLEAIADLAETENLDIVSKELIERALVTRSTQYDRAYDNHFDTASAFIKSIRGSDPDAALFWMAKMLEGGEEPEFISRRILISASEDVGNADPAAISVAIAACEAVERLGLPECTFALAQACIYISCAPKSNTAGEALSAARQAIKDGADVTVPLHLRNNTFSAAENFDFAKGYKNIHNSPEGFEQQQYLPQANQQLRFYVPKAIGWEINLGNRLHKLWGKRYSAD
tara:strand:- start:6722 stop:8044 length:1323 start_codon:yes stop_codon:yes gene_type:complete